MTAPDKIYIPIIEEDGKKLICTNWWEKDTSSRNAYVNETIPYIRKDALIEKIDEILNAKPDGGLAVDIAAQALIDIKKVINSI